MIFLFFVFDCVFSKKKKKKKKILSSTGNNAESTQASGAYIFRPNRTETFGVESPNNHPQTIAVHRGPWVAEVYQVSFIFELIVLKKITKQKQNGIN